MIKVSAYIRKYWYMYAAALVCMILQVGLDMLSPQVTARLIDDVLGKRQAELLPKLLLMIFTIGAGRAVFGKNLFMMQHRPKLEMPSGKPCLCMCRGFPQNILTGPIPVS